MFWNDLRDHDGEQHADTPVETEPSLVVEPDEADDSLDAQIAAFGQQINAAQADDTTPSRTYAASSAQDHNGSALTVEQPPREGEPASVPVDHPQANSAPPLSANTHMPEAEGEGPAEAPPHWNSPTHEQVNVEGEQAEADDPVGQTDQTPRSSTASTEVDRHVPSSNIKAAAVASRLDALEAAANQPVFAGSGVPNDVSNAHKLLSEAAELAQMETQIVIKQAEIAAAGLIAKAREDAARIIDQARQELADARQEAEMILNRARAQSDQLLAAAQTRSDGLLDQAHALSEVARVAMQSVQSAADRAASDLSHAHRTITSQMSTDSVARELRIEQTSPDEAQ